MIDGFLFPSRFAENPGRKVVALGGDGIGREVTASAVRALRATGAPVDVSTPAHGADTKKTMGTGFPPDVRAECLAADAILFGATEGPSHEILRFLRIELDTYANVRPSATLAGVKCVAEKKVNLVLVREATEGLYPGREGRLAELAQRWPDFKDRLGRPFPTEEGRFAVRVVTERATARIAKHAARLALHRKALGISSGRVTIVTKDNVLKDSDGLFRSVSERELAAAGVEHDQLHVDEAARRLVSRPDAFDVIVTSNLFGDILSDVAAEVVGGMPLAPSAGIGERHAYFEPVHGTAPDIVGKGIANPTGAILSAAMMLAYLGHKEAARKLADAVAGVLAKGVGTRDLGKDATTESFTDAVIAAL